METFPEYDSAVVSEPIFYNEDNALTEFFCQYHNAPLDVCSVDTTVSVPSHKDMHVVGERLGHGTDQLLMEMTLPVGISTWSFIVPILKARPYTPPWTCHMWVCCMESAKRQKSVPQRHVACGSARY